MPATFATPSRFRRIRIRYHPTSRRDKPVAQFDPDEDGIDTTFGPRPRPRMKKMIMLLTKLQPVLAGEGHAELREMYRAKFEDLDKSVIENVQGKHTYPDKGALKEYMQLRRIDEHVRLAGDITQNEGTLTPSKDIAAHVNHWKSKEMFKHLDTKIGVQNGNSKKSLRF